MKKILLPLLILVALVVLLILMMNNQEDTSATAKPMSEFAIKDTAAVDQIKITESNGVSIVVQRRTTQGEWKLNEGNYEARADAVNLILETAYRIKVRQEVDPSAMRNIITQIAARNKKVEFFKDGSDEPFKTYYVGNATPDKLGTYMLLKVGDQKGDIPYIMHKPGMYGHLDSRFFADMKEWRSVSVFRYNRGEIAKVHLQFYEEPHNSHVVTVDPGGDVQLFDHTGAEVTDFDISAVHRYVTLVKDLNYEGFNKELSMQEVDSVMRSQPLYSLAITDNEGVTKKVYLHRKKAPDGITDYKGDSVLWDKDRYWGYIEGSNELMKLQFFSWGPVFKPISFFTSK